jgi:ATP-dependent Clp protease ATP-binding subunit ClpB
MFGPFVLLQTGSGLARRLPTLVKNTVIIMTSNIGSMYLIDGLSAQGEIREDARVAVMGELRRHFRPEFLNRVDDIVLFKPLTMDEIKKIIDLLSQDLSRRLAGRRLQLHLSDAAHEFIAKSGYDPVYGARPLKRFIQRELETRILVVLSLPEPFRTARRLMWMCGMGNWL